MFKYGREIDLGYLSIFFSFSNIEPSRFVDLYWLEKHDYIRERYIFCSIFRLLLLLLP
jgi:hypothetical protein